MRTTSIPVWKPRIVEPKLEGPHQRSLEHTAIVPRTSAHSPSIPGYLEKVRDGGVSGSYIPRSSQDSTGSFNFLEEVGHGINTVRKALGERARQLQASLSTPLGQEKEVEGQKYKVTLGGELARNLPVELRDYVATGALATAGTYAAVIAGAAAAPVAIPAAISMVGLSTVATLGSKMVVEGAKYLASRSETSKLTRFLNDIIRVKIDHPDLIDHAQSLPEDMGVCYFDIKGSTALFEKHGVDFITGLSSNFMQQVQDAAVKNGLPPDYLLSVHGGDGFTAVMNKAIFNRVKANFSKIMGELESMGIQGRLRFATQAELGDIKLNLVETPSGRLQPLIHGELDAVFKKTDNFQLGKPLSLFAGQNTQGSQGPKRPSYVEFKDGTQAVGLILSSIDKSNSSEAISRVISEAIDPIYGDSNARLTAIRDSLLRNTQMSEREIEQFAANSDFERLNTFVLVGSPAQSRALEEKLKSIAASDGIVFGLSVDHKIHSAEPVRSKEKEFGFVGSNNLLAASIPFKKMLKKEFGNANFIASRLAPTPTPSLA